VRRVRFLPTSFQLVIRFTCSTLNVARMFCSVFRNCTVKISFRWPSAWSQRTQALKARK
jgi:hypothetical protein